MRASLSDQPIGRGGAGKPVLSLWAGRRCRRLQWRRCPVLLACFGGGPDQAHTGQDGRQRQRKRDHGLPRARWRPHRGRGASCEDDEILIAKAGGQVLRIETGAKLRPVPTGAAGMVGGVKVEAGDRVVCAVKAAGTSLLTVHASGMGLAVPSPSTRSRPGHGRRTVGPDRQAGQVPRRRGRPGRLSEPDRRDRAVYRPWRCLPDHGAGQPVAPASHELASVPAPRPGGNAPRPSFMDGGINILSLRHGPGPGCVVPVGVPARPLR